MGDGGELKNRVQPFLSITHTAYFSFNVKVFIDIL